MQIEELQTIIFKALEDAKTQEGHTIYDKFHPLEVADIVNGIMFALPQYPDFIIDDISKRTLNVIPLDLKEDVLNAQLKDLFKILFWQKITKEQLIQLCTLLLVKYKDTFNDSITEAFQEVREFYYSFPIVTAQELLNEVKEVVYPDGITMNHNNYFIRLTKEYEFIPTTTTLSNYPNFLYKFNN